jgi:hypothetical protein
MAFEGSPAYTFTPEGVREGAQVESGVYAVYTPTRWVFIGDSDNMRQALFDKLNTPDGCIESHHPLSFSCEPASPADRVARREALVSELRPRCNTPLTAIHRPQHRECS